jgi:hypothetical protein
MVGAIGRIGSGCSRPGGNAPLMIGFPVFGSISTRAPPCGC